MICTKGINFTKIFTKIVRGQNEKEIKEERKKIGVTIVLPLFVECETCSL
jgi:hypothetical protein